MKALVLILAVLLVGCASPPVVTLDEARDQYYRSLAIYRTCVANGNDDRCRPERLTMEANQRAYADAMSSGMRADVTKQSAKGGSR
jgi:hypothetical protein